MGTRLGTNVPPARAAGLTRRKLAFTPLSPTFPRHALQLSLGGLAGGHSGLMISQGLGNAVQLVAGALAAVLQAAPGARLVEMRGGEARRGAARSGRGAQRRGVSGFGGPQAGSWAL